MGADAYRALAIEYRQKAVNGPPEAARYWFRQAGLAHDCAVRLELENDRHKRALARSLSQSVGQGFKVPPEGT
jgi:hypothetical protein